MTAQTNHARFHQRNLQQKAIKYKQTCVVSPSDPERIQQSYTEMSVPIRHLESCWAPSQMPLPPSCTAHTHTFCLASSWVDWVPDHGNKSNPSLGEIANCWVSCAYTEGYREGSMPAQYQGLCSIWPIDFSFHFFPQQNKAHTITSTHFIVEKLKFNAFSKAKQLLNSQSFTHCHC